MSLVLVALVLLVLLFIVIDIIGVAVTMRRADRLEELLADLEAQPDPDPDPDPRGEADG